ncbi:MAG TPA: hypothetical protein VMF67_12700 [Rhizomicrobium sp.]|nr:hypothetical protein [Rhizomicrobium sp.]
MSKLAKVGLAALLPASALVFCAGLPAQAQPVRNLPINRAVNVQGVGIACTGIGFRAERNPRWRNYPVKLEVVNRRGDYLANENVTLFDSHAGTPIRVRCDAPWVLMRLPAGRYEANVTMANGSGEKVTFNAPRAGQSNVIVRFAA